MVRVKKILLFTVKYKNKGTNDYIYPQDKIFYICTLKNMFSTKIENLRGYPMLTFLKSILDTKKQEFNYKVKTSMD